MLQLLGDVSGKSVLEPCAGRGALVSRLDGSPSRLDAVEIDGRNIEILKLYSPPWLNVIHADFLEECPTLGRSYDAVICNPPYGLRPTPEYRLALRHRYPDLYVTESYGLFLCLGIRSLVPGGRYVYIVPDTFLTSHNLRPIRRFLLTEGAPTHIVRFSATRFQTVDFNYGRLCVIAGNRHSLANEDAVAWIDEAPSERSLNSICFDASSRVSGTYLSERTEAGWVQPSKIAAINFSCPSTTLGEIAECRTGLYTGDNLRFCGYNRDRPPARRLNGQPIDWPAEVHLNRLDVKEREHGLTGNKRFVPLIRGGCRHPFAETRWAVDWSGEALEAYRQKGKARLQNRRFYFRRGLAVPMVSTGRLSASLMSDAVFDQGVVGVFPHNEAWLEFLLIYLNGAFVSNTVKPVLSPGANNSANYIKRIPVPWVGPAGLEEARQIVEQAVIDGWESTAQMREAFLRRAHANEPALFAFEEAELPEGSGKV
ncbi:MAG: hypothetical protein P4L46_09275 [Fimbriimonas sp.]|nr:hypothetical protein [Fimbriimonas sp.]